MQEQQSAAWINPLDSANLCARISALGVTRPW